MKVMLVLALQDQNVIFGKAATQKEIGLKSFAWTFSLWPYKKNSV